jgi:hypothetical protein
MPVMEEKCPPRCEMPLHVALALCACSLHLKSHLGSAALAALISVDCGVVQKVAHHWRDGVSKWRWKPLISPPHADRRSFTAAETFMPLDCSNGAYLELCLTSACMLKEQTESDGASTEPCNEKSDKTAMTSPHCIGPAPTPDACSPIAA